MVLEILISGLIAFVKQSCVTNDAQSVHVLMMKGHGGQDHVARLIVDVRDLAPFPTDPKELALRLPDEIIQLPKGIQMAIWELDRRRVNIIGAPPIGVYEGHRDPSVYLPDPYNNPPNDFSWAPELHRACDTDQGNAKPKQETIEDRKLPSYASNRLTSLKVLKPNQANKNLDMLEAAFDDPSNAEEFTFSANYHQALADGAKLTMHFADKTVEIDLESFAGQKTRKIVLQARENGAPASILISNLPKIVEAPSKNPLKHFEAYFDVLQPPGHPRKCTVPSVFTKSEADEQHGLLLGVHPVKCTICVDCGP